MAKLKSIKLFSLAKFQAIILAFIGLIAGCLYSFGGAIIDIYTMGELNFGSFLAFLALAGMPLIFSFLGFIFGIVEALIFNFIAPKFGGFEIDFENN